MKERKKIIFLGKSDKFIKTFDKLFECKLPDIISWRDCRKLDNENINNKLINPDFLVVCGYDYGSGLYSLDKHIKANVLNPLSVIEKITGPNTIIIYIDTEDSPCVTTYSRYRFAKNKLACELNKYGDLYKRVILSAMVDSNGKADVHGNTATNFCFNLLINLKLIKTINPDELSDIIYKAIHLNSAAHPKALTGKYLNIKRSIFLDRFLRFFCG